VNEWMTVNDEIERIWKETVVACFKVLYRNWWREIMKTMTKLTQGSQSFYRWSNPRSPKHEPQRLTQNV
jgi:hypothetical protein